MVKAVIFDIDGTLVDSVDLHARAWVEAFAKFGHDISYHKIRSQIGKGGDQLLPVFLSPEQQKEYGKQMEEFRGELFKTKYMSQVKPLPRVRELLERVANDGKQIALASSAKEDEIATYKRIANIEDLVEEEASSDDAERSKPHPDIFEAALERLHNVTAVEAVTVGDSPYDAIAARKIKMKCIGVLSGGFPEDDLRAAGCSAIYQDCADLLDHYDQSLLVDKKAA
jgi:HAD superfamily hydrolase (TIGR01549 family)